MATSNWSGVGFDPDSYQKGSAGAGRSGGTGDTYDKSRFFTGIGDEKLIIFLHDLRGCARAVEHEIWNPDEGTRGKPHHLLCRKYLEGIDKRCLPCDKQSKPGRVLVMSVLDVNGFTIKKAGEPDKEFKNLKRLFIIPYPMIDLFVRKEKDAGGSLKMKKFKIYRSRKNTSRLGEDFTFIGPASEDELKAQGIDYTPFDYIKIIPVETSTYEYQLEFDAAYPNAIYERKKKDGAAPSPASTPASSPKPQAQAPTPPPQADPDENIHYDESTDAGQQSYPPF
jgi:hypothetical protein